VLTDDTTESVILQANPVVDKQVRILEFPYLELGNSDQVSVGQTAYTFGDAMGSINADNQISVSAGLISGIYSLTRTGTYQLEPLSGRYNEVVIETTAAVNGGIDGGPLIAADKKIIGLVCFNYSRARWLGVAIPINKIKSRLNEKIKLPTEQPDQINDAALGFSYLIKDKAPAIVGIKVEFLEKPGPSISPVNPPLPGRRIDSPLPSVEGEYKEYLTRPDGYLSGVLISHDGYILTSYQNVKGKIKNITVSFQADNQKQNFPAEITGWDEELDIALLKVDQLPQETKPLTFPDEIQLKTGHWAIVIG
ncbi:MAG: trypsin-like peptidase domain-containing protein, partial [Planctomycetota bacterium]